jgi:hypothetical protein
MGKYRRTTSYGILKEAGKKEDRRIAGEDRLSKKWIEAGMNQGSWQLTEVERTRRQHYVPPKRDNGRYYYYYYYKRQYKL